MLIAKEDITRFIPQRAPFVMLDELVEGNADGFKTRFLVQEDNLLLQNGVLSESAVLEHIAQSCAAGFGFVNSGGDGEDRKGFIGAITRVEVFFLPKLGDLIETEITLLSSFEQINLVQGVAMINGITCLSCQLKIVLS